MSTASASLAPSPPAPARIRSFTGCRTCRADKVKCDENRPSCRRCSRLDRACDFTPVPRKRYTRRAKSAAQTLEHGDECRELPGRAIDRHPSTSYTPTRDHLYEPIQSHEPPPSSTPESRPTINPEPSIAFDPDLLLSPTCKAILTCSDGDAIHMFRFVLPLAGDDIHPDYSGPNLIWTLARSNPMVLHLVCAIGWQKWCQMHAASPQVGARRLQALKHYGDSLRLLRTVTRSARYGEKNDDLEGAPDTSNVDMLEEWAHLDHVLATLWLMVIYELKYGDGCGDGLNTHLCGVAHILQGRLLFGPLLQPPPSHSPASSAALSEETRGSLERPSRPALGPDPDNNNAQGDNLDARSPFEHLTPLSCKIVVWMALLDGGARINGFGGSFNRMLGQTIPSISVDPVGLRLEFLRDLQQRASKANSYVWGSSYPQSLLIEDLRNIQLACLHAESGQLRFLIGALHTTEHEQQHTDSLDTVSLQNVVEGAKSVGKRYHEYITVVDRLHFAGDAAQKAFTCNALIIVSFYHAVILCLLGLVEDHAETRGQRHPDLGLTEREMIRHIMSSAFKLHASKGPTGAVPLAWPLYVAGIASDDMIHRTWILERFDEMMHQGEHLCRARNSLHVLFQHQRMDERKISYRQLIALDQTGRFLL